RDRNRLRSARTVVDHQGLVLVVPGNADLVAALQGRLAGLEDRLPENLVRGGRLVAQQADRSGDERARDQSDQGDGEQDLKKREARTRGYLHQLPISSAEPSMPSSPSDHR